MKLRISFLLTAFALSAAQIPNLSGTWNLDVAKSSWGKKAKPQSVSVQLEHNEPNLKYSGVATDADGNQTKFDLDTPIDGQEHPVKTSYGPGKIAIKRVNPYTTNSVFQSDDGKFTERAITTVSRDGRTLTRAMHTKGPRATPRGPKSTTSSSSVFESEDFSEGEIDARFAGERVIARLERSYAVIDKAGRSAPDGDIAAFEPQATEGIFAALAAP